MDLAQCLPPLQGLTANPDISGIGVRAAIYTQALLSLVHPLVAGYDGKIEDYEMKSLFTVYLGILLPGCALLFSTIIQARTFGLSVYHGTIVLYLSWINNTSALTFFMFVMGDRMLFLQRENEWWERREKFKQKVDSLELEWKSAEEITIKQWDLLNKVEEMVEEMKLEGKGPRSKYSKRSLKMEIREARRWRLGKMIEMVTASGSRPLNQGDVSILENLRKKWVLQEEVDSGAFRGRRSGRLGLWISRFQPIPASVWVMATLASAHLILFSGFGLWLWLTLHNFGIERECIPSIHLILFSSFVPITSKVLRSTSIGLYVFSSLPFLNIVVWILIFTVVPASITLLWMCVVNLTSGVSHGAPTLEPNDDARSLQKIDGESDIRSLEDNNAADAPTPEKSKPIHKIFGLHGPAFFFSAVFTVLVVQSLFISFTELTIKSNRHLLKTGPQDPREGDWTFGQALAVTLTVIPLIEVVKFLRLKIVKLKWWKAWMEKITPVSRTVTMQDIP